MLVCVKDRVKLTKENTFSKDCLGGKRAGIYWSYLLILWRFIIDNLAILILYGAEFTFLFYHFILLREIYRNVPSFTIRSAWDVTLHVFNNRNFWLHQPNFSLTDKYIDEQKEKRTIWGLNTIFPEYTY